MGIQVILTCAMGDLNMYRTRQWGFDTRSSCWNIRVAEAHEMHAGGSLADTHHYDIGSLITVDIMLEGTLIVRSTWQ